MPIPYRADWVTALSSLMGEMKVLLIFQYSVGSMIPHQRNSKASPTVPSLPTQWTYHPQRYSENGCHGRGGGTWVGWEAVMLDKKSQEAGDKWRVHFKFMSIFLGRKWESRTKLSWIMLLIKMLALADGD